MAAAQDMLVTTPAGSAPALPKLAAQYQLKLRLPEGRGLARFLLDAGVGKDDAASAARLAAGHLGAGSGGCQATISIERNAGGDFSLVRVQLMTDARLTVIERRGRDLTIASDTARSNALTIV